MCEVNTDRVLSHGKSPAADSRPSLPASIWLGSAKSGLHINSRKRGNPCSSRTEPINYLMSRRLPEARTELCS